MKKLGMKFVLVACLAIVASTVGCKDDKKTPTPAVDAGSDAAAQTDGGGKADAGGKDAGGKDAGGKDAGGKDAGGNDSGTEDAGSNDAGN